MKNSGVSCETKLGLLFFLGHPSLKISDGSMKISNGSEKISDGSKKVSHDS